MKRLDDYYDIEDGKNDDCRLKMGHYSNSYLLEFTPNDDELDKYLKELEEQTRQKDILKDKYETIKVPFEMTSIFIFN